MASLGKSTDGDMCFPSHGSPTSSSTMTGVTWRAAMRRAMRRPNYPSPPDRAGAPPGHKPTRWRGFARHRRATDQGVCAFTGSAGAGKSTLAASFVLAGYPLLCDDCLTLANDTRLWPSPGILVCGYRMTQLMGWRTITEIGTSRALHDKIALGEPFCFHQLLPESPSPRVRLFAQTKAREPKVGKCTNRKIDAHFGSDGSGPAAYRMIYRIVPMLARQFHIRIPVAQRVMVKRLTLPDDFSALAEVRHAILGDLRDDCASR